MCCRCIIRFASPSNGRRSICLSGGRVDFASGRGYDRREYGPFGANFEDNTGSSPKVSRSYNVSGKRTGRSRITANATLRRCRGSRRSRCSGRCRPMSHRFPAVDRARGEARAGLVVAAGAATSVHGGLAQVAKLYRDVCAAAGKPPGRLVTSYFIHFADTPARRARRARAAASLSPGMHLARLPGRSRDRARGL